MPDQIATDRLAEARQILRDAIVIDTLGGAVVHPTPHVAEGTYEEMMVGFFDIAIRPELDKWQYFVRPTADSSPSP